MHVVERDVWRGSSEACSERSRGETIRIEEFVDWQRESSRRLELGKELKAKKV